MQSQEKDNLIIARFFPEEDVYEKLRELCQKHKAKTAVVLSGLGQLATFELGFFKEKGNYLPQKFAEPQEMVSLTGTILLQDGNYEFHLHAMLSAADKFVVGGHLISAKVSVTAEIVLLKTDVSFYRQVEPETGLKGMFLE